MAKYRKAVDVTLMTPEFARGLQIGQRVDCGRFADQPPTSGRFAGVTYAGTVVVCYDGPRKAFDRDAGLQGAHWQMSLNYARQYSRRVAARSNGERV